MGRTSKNRSWLADFGREQSANAVVEYAVCLGLVVATVLAAGFFLGGSLRNAFSKAADGIQQTAAQRSGQPTEVAQASSPAATEAHAPGVGPAVWTAIVACAVVPLLTASWISRRRAKRQPPAPASPDSMPVPQELQAKFVAKRQAILQFLSAEKQQLVNGQMMVKHVMSRKPLTRSPDDDLAEIKALMNENVIRHLLVCSASGELLGIVSDRDVNARHGKCIADIMTANPITVTPETPVRTVITILLTKRISCVPVVCAKRLCGIVTTSDLLMALQCVMRLVEQLALPIDLHPG
ncbi:MAG TPA: CBS domain-containing protein, partial [Pirellulales bacterium]